MVRDWDRLLRAVVTTPCLTEFRNIWTTISGTWCVLHRARSLIWFQLSIFCESVILCLFKALVLHMSLSEHLSSEREKMQLNEKVSFKGIPLAHSRPLAYQTAA